MSGDDDAQRLAAQLVATVDRPNRARADLPRGGEPVLEGYAVDPRGSTRPPLRCASVFPLASGAKIAVNQRSNQVLVLAPPDVQVQLWRALETLDVGVSENAADRPAAVATSQKPIKRIYTLKQLEPPALEKRAGENLGPPVADRHER